MTKWLRRVWHLINRRRFEHDLAREMREHREMMPDSQGFGDSYRLLEQSRDAWGWNWLDEAVQDLRLGTRALWRSPVFAATAFLILSFGVGLNLTLFQVATAVVLRPPAVRQPETLARFHRYSSTFHWSGLPYAATQVIAARNDALSAVLVESSTSVVWGREGGDEIDVSFVSSNWFSELGLDVIAGRGFAEGIDTGAASTVAIASHEFWRTRLGADPAVVGTTVYLNARPVLLVGIAGPEVPALDGGRPSAWLPIEQREQLFPEDAFLRTFASNNSRMYGRIREGLSPAAARESLKASMGSLARQQPDEFEADAWLEPMMATENFMTPQGRARAWMFLSLLTALTGLVLVVAAANIGNLVLSRATGRARELGVRVALGARRSRIVRQLIAETAPLGVLGAAGALVFAAWSAPVLAAAAGLPPYLAFAIDWRTIGVSIGLSIVALAVLGALPAWKVAQQDLMLAIRDGGQQVSLRLDRARLRRSLLAAQVAGSCLLLVLAGMAARRVQHALSPDVGFKFAQSLVMDAKLGSHGVSGEAARVYWHGVKERVLANPEAAAVAIVTAPPLGGRVHENGFREAPGLSVLLQKVDPAYFSLMKIPIVAGRTFADADPAGSSAIISRRLALDMYGSTDVVGRGFPRLMPDRTIVGVAEDAHSIMITATNVAELYLPLETSDYDLVFLLARARGDASTLVPVLREAARLDARVTPSISLMRDDFDRRLRAPRLATAMVTGIGLITLVLACLGIFGVVSYSADLRTKEIGIHVALGARGRPILRLILRHVLAPVAAGIMIGVVAAVPAARALSGEPWYLETVDPVVFAAAVAAFLVAGGVAALVPAVRVLWSDPIQSLRHE